MGIIYISKISIFQALQRISMRKSHGKSLFYTCTFWPLPKLTIRFAALKEVILRTVWLHSSGSSHSKERLSVKPRTCLSLPWASGMQISLYSGFGVIIFCRNNPIFYVWRYSFDYENHTKRSKRQQMEKMSLSCTKEWHFVKVWKPSSCQNRKGKEIANGIQVYILRNSV